MRAVIVEDEPSGMKNLQNLLAKYCEQVEVVATAENVESAIKLFNTPSVMPDVAFLDISLPDGLVFQVLNQVEDINFDIIFVTAYKDFAIKACDYSSIGYIVKPIDPDELKAAVSRVKANKSNRIKERLDTFKGHYSNPNAFGKMSISAVDGFYFINIKDIMRLEAEDNYTHIFTNTGERMTVAKTIKSYEELLSGVNFFRVHKRHLINLNFMNKFLKGDSIVVMDDNMKIEVSRRRRPQFMELMKRLQVEIQDL
ncbi:MAG: response regulator transcription factor [Saprospiraceae bacterium]|nr:response regulator transcription factor [Saprospiraceae bacterium]